MSWSKALSPKVNGEHYRRQPLAVWAVLVAIAFVSSMLSSLPVLNSPSAQATTGSQPSITQNGYIFEDESGSGVDNSTQQAAANTPITGVKKGERLTARFQLSNNGAALSSDLGLFYDRNDGIWKKVESGSTPITSSGSCLDTNWDCAVVDSTGSVGEDASMAVDSEGNPWISYADNTNYDLRVARYVATGGTGCATSAWTCVSVDTSGNFGEHTSIAFSRTGAAWISYYDGPNGDLKVAQYVGSGGTGCAISSWTCTLVESTNVVGWYTSIAFDSSGNPWVVHRDFINDDLRLARYVGSGGTGCASSAWTCYAIDTTNSLGEFPYIAFDPSGNAWVAYRDLTAFGLRVARYVGSGGTGCASSAWTCTAVLSTGNATDISMAIDPAGDPWISFYRSGDLGIAKYVGSGGTGCTSSAWTCTSVDTLAGTVGVDTAIAMDPAGNPWVSHRDSTNSGLRVARYVGSGGTGCGIASWTCTAIETANSVGEYTDIAFSPSGTAWVNFYDATNADLRVAKLRPKNEIVMSAGLAGANGDAISESHVDMTSTSDTSNRDDADCVTGGANWNNGKWFESENGGSVSLPSGTGTVQCTEVAFSIDTSQATAGTTYRFAVASKDNWRKDKGTWRGPIAVTNYATLTIEDPTFTRVSKDNGYAMSNCNDTAWGCAIVDGVGGENSSIAIDPSGNPWISSGDTTGTDLRLARYVGSGGTGCSTAAWTCIAIDTGTISDLYTSIGFDNSGTPWISYYDAAGNDLKVARYVGSGGTGCAVSSWSCVLVDTTGSVGYNTSMVFDPNGNPWVSYQDITNGDLKIARYVGANGSGCAVATWSCVSVYTTGTVGNDNSIAFDPSGNAWVSFRDNTNMDLLLARYVGVGGTGCAVTSWTCTTVDSTNNVSNDNSISFDSSGTAWISYYDASNGNLRVAQYVGSSGSGCSSTAWTCTAVDTTNDVGLYSSINFDAVGNPWVSYQDVTNTAMRVARYVGSSGTGCAVATWTCTNVDLANDVGQHSAMAFDHSGTPWLSYKDVGNNDLRVAKLHLPPTQPSYATKYAYPKRSAIHGDARYRLDSVGDINVQTVNSTFDEIAATSSETPMYVGAKRSSSASALPSMSWTGQSTVAFTTRAASVQVWNNTTKAWATPGSVTNGCSATGANTNCTITATVTGATPTDYYESDGSYFWAYFRVYQASGSTETLKTDQFYVSTSASASRPEFSQRGYVWENDDGGVDANTQQAAGNTAITSVAKGERATLRIQIDNAAAASSGNLGLFYDRNDGLWSQVGPENTPITGNGSGCTSTTFDCVSVSSTNDVGQYNYMAMDASGRPWVSYYDNTGGDLIVAMYVGSGGTGCASSSWQCTTVDSTNNVGQYTSIAFDANNSPWVAYYDVTNLDLRVARYVGSGGTGCATSSWTCTTVESTNSVGVSTSIAFDSSGAAWIAYYEWSSYDLHVARYVGSGGTGCATAVWTCTNVESTGMVGIYASMAFDPSGKPWIAYSDNTNNDLRLARYVGSSGSGCADSAWTCTALDTPGDVGKHGSLAFDPYGNPWISYYKHATADLMVAKYVGTGGTGCDVTSWTCTTVDSSNATGLYTSLAFDPSGNAWITYYDDTNDDLRLARYVGSGGTGCAVATWTCVNVDTTSNTGQYTSLAFDQAGNGWFSYYDVTNGDLRVGKVRRNAELFTTAGLAGASGDALSESHVDMTTTGDTTNRDDADCAGGTGYQWNNGKWYESIEAASLGLSYGHFSPQCTEVSFTIDTSQATAGTTYRFVIASKDAFRSDKGLWRGPVSVANYPSLTVEANTTLRVAKESQAKFNNCSNTAWGCVNLVTAGDFGYDTSLAISPTGVPWVVAMDWTTNTYLIVSRYVGSGGTGCASAAWTCTTLTPTGADSGDSPEIKFDPTGTPWIAYASTTDGSVMVARYVGSGGTGCQSTEWTCTAVVVGYSPSLAFDQAGNPWVSYADSTDMRVAKYVGSGGTGCTSSAWTCVMVDGAGLYGANTSIAIDKFGNPWIGHVSYSTDDELRVARYVGSGGTGCSITSWTCYSIDVTNVANKKISVEIDTSGYAWVVYQDFDNQNLDVARYVGSGGTGCVISSWSCETIKAGANWGGAEIAFDPTGAAWVSYQNIDNEDIDVARYVGSSGTGCDSSAWTCQSVDGSIWSAEDTTIAFDSSGVPWMAYMNGNNDNLRLAKMHKSPFKLSYQSTFTNADRNGTDGDALYHLDKVGRSALSADDTTYDTMASPASETPIYTFAQRSASNSTMPDYDWVGQSSVSTATRNATIEIYRFGSTNAWVTVDTESTAVASTQFTLRGVPTSGTASEYWESDGGNYWAYYRISQAAHTSAQTLTADFFEAHVNVAPTVASSLAQKTTGDVVLTTGQWHNSTSVKFTGTLTDADNPDTLQLCVEAKALAQSFTNTENSCGTGVAFSGTGVSASVTLTLTDATEYHWQARVKDAGGLYSAWVSYDVNLESARDVGIDTTAPTGGTVYDGTVNGIDSGFNTGSLSQLSANWASVNSNVSGLAGYEYSIGTTVGGTDIKTWTSNGTATSVTASALTLHTGQLYYFNVRTTDNAGNVSSVISSDGQLVAPTLTFTVSSPSVVFANLNPSNSYADSKTLTATVTTNAYNGYQVTQYANGLMTAGSNSIAMYAGTWASPTPWTGTGLGYTSSDASVSGSNRFAGATQYAGVKNGAAGDVVADSSVSAVSGDPYTLTYRATTSTIQAAGVYSTTLVLTATASF